MALYSSDADFATSLLTVTNCLERCTLKSSKHFSSGHNKAVQLNQLHRAMHHRNHQAEF